MKAGLKICVSVNILFSFLTIWNKTHALFSGFHWLNALFIALYLLILIQSLFILFKPENNKLIFLLILTMGIEFIFSVFHLILSFGQLTANSLAVEIVSKIIILSIIIFLMLYHKEQKPAGSR